MSPTCIFTVGLNMSIILCATLEFKIAKTMGCSFNEGIIPHDADSIMNPSGIYLAENRPVVILDQVIPSWKYKSVLNIGVQGVQTR